MRHVPVLTNELLSGLEVAPTDTVFDGTLGAAGHAKAILTQLEDGLLIGTDKDRAAIEKAKDTLEKYQKKTCLQVADFREIGTVLESCGESEVDKAVLDLGFRSEQLESGRGLSFQENEPLLMTLEDAQDVGPEDLTAKKILNQWSKDSLEQIFSGYGNEEFADEIAHAIIEERATEPITTTGDLVEIIKAVVPRWYKKLNRHPATKVFQALRITVNDEITAVKEGIENIFSRLNPAGRFAIISFHSLEDRTVKNAFKEKVQDGKARHIIKKPITPKREEIDFNPRARSAKLRILEKTS